MNDRGPWLRAFPDGIEYYRLETEVTAEAMKKLAWWIYDTYRTRKYNPSKLRVRSNGGNGPSLNLYFKNRDLRGEGGALNAKKRN